MRQIGLDLFHVKNSEAESREHKLLKQLVGVHLAAQGYTILYEKLFYFEKIPSFYSMGRAEYPQPQIRHPMWIYGFDKRDQWKTEYSFFNSHMKTPKGLIIDLGGSHIREWWKAGWVDVFGEKNNHKVFVEC